jgi:predicted TPR repeat methyltransferase
LQQALSLRPQDASAHVNMGNLHATQGRFDQALAHYVQALKSQPDSVDAHLNLGHALVKQGRAAEALGPLEAGLAIAPDHPQMQLYLCEAVYFLSLADQETALAHAKRLLAAYGDKPLVRRALSGLVGLPADVASDSEYSRVLFDTFAPGFDKALSELGYLPTAHSIVAALGVANEAAALDILDAGCGTGLCAEFLRPPARTLTGVDLSPNMLAKARARGAYDRLECGDAIAFMQQNRQAFDVIVSSDVLTYIGDGAGFLRAAHHALRPGGKLAISVESLQADGTEGSRAGFALAPSGRYQHARGYLEAAFADAGFRVTKMIEGVLRREVGQPLASWIVVGEKPA